MKIPTLAERCRIHAEKMQGEGWYSTANVLAEASEVIKIAARAVTIANETSDEKSFAVAIDELKTALKATEDR